jgi:hypothetical protein
VFFCERFVCVYSRFITLSRYEIEWKNIFYDLYNFPHTFYFFMFIWLNLYIVASDTVTGGNLCKVHLFQFVHVI